MARLVGSSELEVLAQYRLGHVLASRGEITEAVAALLASARNAEVYRMHLDAADSWLYLAKIATEDLKDVDKAGEWTMAVLRVMFKGDGSRVADYHELRGLQAFLAGQYKAAAYEHEYALNIRRSQGPTGDPIAFSKSLNNLANTLAMHGDPDEARKHYQGALTERVKALGPDHPLVGEVVFNLGRLEASEKNWNEARHFFQHALRIDQATHGSDHPGTLHTLLAWAFTELQANGIDRAEKLTNQIVTIHRRLKAENDPAARLPIRAQEHLMIAAVHEKREHIEDALAEVLAAIDIYEANKVEKTRSRESANYAWALWDAAKFYCKLGQSKLARKRTLEALALQDRWYEEDAAVLRGEMREEMDKQCRP
jgi:tetratricopeptide (TPR) repeat protein